MARTRIELINADYEPTVLPIKLSSRNNFGELKPYRLVLRRVLESWTKWRTVGI
jgi:hypothetical protein